MANQSHDRQRMRHDLRELAKLATPAPPVASHGFDTADSSGYVDLSAYSARDPAWVDRELARAKKGAPPPPPASRPRTVDTAMPASMAPVALEAFLSTDDTARFRPSKARRALYAVLGLAGVGLVGFLAVTLAKHPPPAAVKAQAAAAVVAPPPPTTPAVTAETPAPTPVAAPTSVATAPATVAATTPPVKTAPVVATTTAPRRRAATTHVHVAAASAPAALPAAAPVRTTPAARPAVAHASSGGDSLLDLIKKSVATGK